MHFTLPKAPPRPGPWLDFPLTRTLFATAISLTAMVILIPGRPATAQTPDALFVSTSPAFFPAFDPEIPDYVIKGVTGSSVLVTLGLPSGDQASVNGQPFQEGAFAASLPLNPGQSISIVVKPPTGPSKTYSLRGLPADFPTWTVERNSAPQAEWFVVSPTGSVTTTVYHNYSIIFDGFGVPVWWYREDPPPNDPKILSDGNIGWASTNFFEERRFDGSLVKEIHVVDAISDTHDLQLLPNGNFLVIAYTLRPHVDLSYAGGSPDATVLDNVVEEIAPDGSLAHSWDVMDHIPVSDTDPVRWADYFKSDPADPYHMNSLEFEGDGYLISCRNLDSVFKVDRATGEIVWKLGGFAHPESLNFQDDSQGDFGGQHDARLLPDGTLTVHDNGTGRNRAPRAVRYQLDTAAGTATLLEQITDPDVPDSFCCGDARKLPEGDWVMSWGSSPYVTELTPQGNRVFRLNFGNYFSYRVEPVSFGVVSRDALRAGMDAQYVQQASTVCKPGDLNGDSQVDIGDAVYLLQAIVHLVTLDARQSQVADVNGDHQLDTNDVIRLLRGALNLESLPNSCG